MEHFSRLFILSHQLEGSGPDTSKDSDDGKALNNLDRLIALYSPPALINGTWKVEGISKSRWDWEMREEAHPD